MSVSAFWCCGHSEHHVFEYGQLAWHLEDGMNQGLDKGHPIPQMCQADLEDGSESCLDSTHLYGPFETRELAEYNSEGYRLLSKVPPRDPAKLDMLKLVVVDAQHKTRDDVETITTARGMAAITHNSHAWHGRNSLTRTRAELDPELVRGLEKFL